jgi:RND family efflux transporter MFP subunit
LEIEAVLSRAKVKPTALFALLTAAACLWAHDGAHEALPTRGVRVEADKGLVLLGPESRKALAVRTAEVTLQTLDERLTAPATLEAPWQGRAFVTTRLGGRLTAVHVQPGQSVSQGQALAEVQSVELENLQLELLQAANEARLSAENLKQLEKGYEQGAIAERTILEARSQDQRHRNDLEIARRKLLILCVDDAFVGRLLAAEAKPLSTLPVTSPIAGVVTRTEARVGQVVDLPDHLFEIVDPSSVWVKMDVLEKDLSKIAVGQPVEVRLAAYPAPGEVFRSSVRVKGLSLDPKTRQGTAWCELSNPPGQRPRFLPGMYGQAEVILSTQEKKATIPPAALISEGAERSVLVEEGPGQYVRQHIVVGRSTPGGVEVRSGQLFPGDRVVTVGSHELATLLVQGVLRLSPQASENIGLRVEPARRRPVGQVAQISGLVDLPADRRAIAPARLPGTIQRILIDRDALVRPGDVIAEVSSVEFQALQLELLRSHLEWQLNDGTAKRIRSLANTGALPERRLREAETAYRASLQRRDSFRRRLEAVGISDRQIQDVMDRAKFVEALPVKAPIAGAVVYFFHAGLGHAVKAEEPLFEVHDVARPVVRGFVSERQLPGLRIGQLARIRLLADPNTVAEATVVRSSQAFGDDDRTLSVWLEPRQPPAAAGGPAWLHGMLARSTVVLSESEPVLAVPREAVLREGTQPYLFVQKADGSFERRRVETGRGDDYFVAVTAELREGEAVAVRGVSDLQTAYAALK